jgi:8-oxo-dGTP pyrophosphatase MutT (NUDIX family)
MDIMSEISPAATVILLRDTPDGMRTLLLRRNSALGFAGGVWVYPGGRVDEAEFAASDSALAAARLAAVRETREEAELRIDAAALHYYAHWTTPPNSPKRFATWFFMTRAPEDHAVTVDGSEIHEYLWVAPSEALSMHARGEIELMPPTFLSLTELTSCRDTDDAIQRARRRVAPVFEPHIVVRNGKPTEAIYFGDAAYRASDPNLPGTRHRIVMTPGNWVYLNEGAVDW